MNQKFQSVDFDAGELVNAAQSLPVSELAALVGRIEEARTIALNRLARDVNQAGASRGDCLLTAEDAAKKLGTSTDWLYRHADELPFTVRLTDKQLRFSELAIERWITARAGK